MKKRIGKIILFVALAAVFCVSLGNIVYTYISDREAKTAYEALQEYAAPHKENVPESAAESTVESTGGAEETPIIPKETAPIDVNFHDLCKKYKNVVGWLYSENTPIHYPVAQGKDNNQYLHRLLSGKYNAAGTLFVDYRNTEIGADENYIIYGHNMKNNTMFGTLTEYKKQSYYEEHPNLYYLTPDGEYKIELITGNVLKSTAAIYTVHPESKETLFQLIEKLKKSSVFESDVTFAPEDIFITLSTCDYNFANARFVLVGKLVKL